MDRHFSGLEAQALATLSRLLAAPLTEIRGQPSPKAPSSKNRRLTVNSPKFKNLFF